MFLCIQGNLFQRGKYLHNREKKGKFILATYVLFHCLKPEKDVLQIGEKNIKFGLSEVYMRVFFWRLEIELQGVPKDAKIL